VIGRHGLAAGSEQAVDRLAERLAARIPERHVERREREQRDALVADKVHLGPKPVPEALDPVRVLPDERLTEDGGHCLQRRQMPGRQREQMALARYLRIGIDEDQHIADRADIVNRGDDRLLQRHVHRHRANTCNFHPSSCLQNIGPPRPLNKAQPSLTGRGRGSGRTARSRGVQIENGNIHGAGGGGHPAVVACKRDRSAVVAKPGA